MKYRVVKDGFQSCEGCVNRRTKIPCYEFIRINRLPECFDNNCHFEEIKDTITDVDLKEIDEAKGL